MSDVMNSYPKSFARHFIGVGAVVIHQGKILLVKPNYGRGKGKFMIPGGFVDQGETLTEAIIREVREETSMNIATLDLLSVRTMVRSSDNVTDLYSIIRCKLLSSPDNIQAQASEIEEVAWIPINNFGENPDLSEYTKIIIKKATQTNEKNGLKLGKELSEKRKKKFEIEKYEEFWIQ